MTSDFLVHSPSSYPDELSVPAALPRVEDPFDGTPYRALRLLHEGGVGRVYLVENRETERRCAAKVLREDYANDRRAVERMRIEAQALGRLEHPHVVAIVGVGTSADGRFFIVTEHLQGSTLADELELRGGRLPVLEAVAYAWQLMSALAAAHQLGIVHRDVRPTNLFLCERSGGPKVLRVLDFGVARVLPGHPGAPAPLETATEEGLVLGSPSYASPELLRGSPADPRSDIYAAALVLYRMLTGHGPHDGEGHDTGERLALRTRSEPVPPSRKARSPIPAELDRLVLRALSENPDDRYQRASEVCAALEEIGMALAGPVGWAETVGFAEETDAGAALPEQSAAGRKPEQRSAEDGKPELPSAPARPEPPRPNRGTSATVFVIVALTAVVVALGVHGIVRWLR